MNEMILEDDTLTVTEFQNIINALGWRLPSERLINLSLENSMSVKCVIDGEVVGMARLITDGGYMALIGDVIVLPEYQGQGIGRKMIERLLSRAEDSLKTGEKMIVQLLASPGNSSFYEKFGFKSKETVVEAGMYKWIEK